MSPLMQARIARFKSHRLGYWSWWLFLLIFVLVMMAELLANDKPLVVSFDGRLYAPFVQAYPETTFGGEFETEADYQDPVVARLIQHKGWMIRAPIPFADQTISLSRSEAFPAPPSQVNWLGTDDQGRDVVARLIYGLRISILFGLGLTLIGSLVGIAIGALQGYFGGLVDLIGQRLLEVWSSLPPLFMIIIVISLFSANFATLFFVMLLFSWTSLVPLVRAEFLRARNFDYVRAAKVLGTSHRVIMFRHILPNAMSSSLSQLPFILTANIGALTALDFLGYGLPPGSASLGELMQQAKDNLDASWLALSGFFTLAILLSLLVFIGEAARDAFDPKQ